MESIEIYRMLLKPLEKVEQSADVATRGDARISTTARCFEIGRDRVAVR